MDRKVCSCCRSLAAAIGKYIAKAEDDLAKELDRMGYAESSDSVKRAGQLEDELAETLTEQTNRIVEFFKKFVSLEVAMELLAAFFDADAARSAIQEIFENYYEKNVPKLANVYIKETDGSMAVSRIRKRTSAWITEWSATLSDMMNLTSEQQIESLLKEAVQNGEGVDAFTRRLMDSGIRNEEWRARRAAITEMLRAHSVAQHEAMIQDASVVWKKWVHTGNYRMEPRKNHLKMHGQTVLKEKPYKLHGIKGGIYYPMYPRDTVLPPEESVSCHCLSQPVVDEDVLGMPLEERQRLQQQIIEEDDGKWMEELDAQNKAKAGIDAKDKIYQTGGKFDVNTYEWEMHRTSQAEKYYEKVRETDDIKAIAEASGISESDIEQIKNHVFYNKHILYDGVVDRFEPDYDMAVAWKRLTEGIPEDRDLLLLKHELLESQVEKEYNLTAAEAHRKATETYDWAGELNEILGQEGEEDDLL